MEQIHGVSDGNINISDVLEVLQTTDPEFVECNGDDREAMAMFSGGGVESVNAGSTIGPADPRHHAYIKILEQPASKALRFRYECEGRSAGSIPGVNSTPENKTYPSIRVENYKGRAIVMVSCVTKDPPYRPHPHNLVGRESCTEGVCTVQISSDNMTVTFANLGIQCVKKKDIQEALNAREKKRVDPYKTGYSHRAQPTSIDLNAVRLCFEVYLEGSQKGKFNIPLTPVVSDPIYDKIEVLQTTDPEFVECNGADREAMAMFSGGGVESVNAGSTIGPADPRRHAYIKILEQPASKALRLRYECEGRSAGSIPGVNSTPENKTYPSIRVENYKGRAIVMVSCVTKDPPYRPHPHNLVGRESCTEGIYTVQISSDNMMVTFANLGIQCVKKKYIQQALNAREKKRVDPYKTGYSHRAQPTSIDLNAVRLCFEVYLEGSQKGKFNIPLTPVVSDPIYDKST